MYYNDRKHMILRKMIVLCSHSLDRRTHFKERNHTEHTRRHTLLCTVNLDTRSVCAITTRGVIRARLNAISDFSSKIPKITEYDYVRIITFLFLPLTFIYEFTLTPAINNLLLNLQFKNENRIKN